MTNITLVDKLVKNHELQIDLDHLVTILSMSTFKTFFFTDNTVDEEKALNFLANVRTYLYYVRTLRTETADTTPELEIPTDTWLDFLVEDSTHTTILIVGRWQENVLQMRKWKAPTSHHD